MMQADHQQLIAIIQQALLEDIHDPSGLIPDGDHSSLSAFHQATPGNARLLVKDDGILAGMALAELIFKEVDPNIQYEVLIKDGAPIKKGDIALTAQGDVRSLLRAERVVLNFMQRMSGIATVAKKYVDAVAGTGCTILDTRKTTPGLRLIEKWAVRIGGASNHRFGLYDMVMLKDNHVDFAGGIKPAIAKAKEYLAAKGMDLPIEVETRNMHEVIQTLEAGGIQRVMLDNFTPEMVKEAVHTIGKHYETEASGGITLDNIRAYAESGVQFISVGALTHSVKSLDLSFKATVA
jgi:nicotinate-nucleotide pyrophosphorylase (carboxylating)